MTTAEDVLYLYERNSLYYDNPSELLYIYDTYDNGKPANLPVNPEIIGNSLVKCDFKRKVYIKPGEECPICFEKIITKKNAYLTACGHSFHKKCLFMTYEANRKVNPYCILKCPICRSNLGLDIKDLAYKYRYPDNQLDTLENFWIRKDFMCCDICPSNKFHYIGMSKICNTCKKYQSGDIMFGI